MSPRSSGESYPHPPARATNPAAPTIARALPVASRGALTAGAAVHGLPRRPYASLCIYVLLTPLRERIRKAPGSRHSPWLGPPALLPASARRAARPYLLPASSAPWARGSRGGEAARPGGVAGGGAQGALAHPCAPPAPIHGRPENGPIGGDSLVSPELLKPPRSIPGLSHLSTTTFLSASMRNYARHPCLAKHLASKKFPAGRTEIALYALYNLLTTTPNHRITPLQIVDNLGTSPFMETYHTTVFHNLSTK